MENIHPEETPEAITQTNIETPESKYTFAIVSFYIHVFNCIHVNIFAQIHFYSIFC